MSSNHNNKVHTRVANQTRIIDIYLIGPIGEAQNYIEEFQALLNAEEGDTVNIYINSGGGYVSTAIQFIENIKQCKGLVTAHLQGECHSAASYIFLACDGWVVPEWSFMLLHNYSGGHYGKGNDLVLATVETDNWITDIMKDIYTPFLTKKELKKLSKGEDIYLRGKEIGPRLQRVVESREQYEEELRLEQLEIVKKQLEGLASDEREDS